MTITERTFTQTEVDEIVRKRLAQQARNSPDAEARAHTWETRATEHQTDADTWRRESRKWEVRAKQNLAVIRAHEVTIARFIDKLDDVLSDEAQTDE